MEFIYTDHLRFRLRQRGIPLTTVKEIFAKSQENYWDNLINHHIVVSKVIYMGKTRKVLAAYDRISAKAEVITVHPVSDSEIRQRLTSGRWSYEKNKN